MPKTNEVPTYDKLAGKLKELSLGVNTKLVEKVSVVDDWFLSL